MKKPNRSEYGYSKKTGWKNQEDRDLYDAALLEWYNQPRKTGKVRVRPIHESWVEILKHFDSSNPQRSQNAFCRWADLNPASFSNWKVKPLSDDLERFILEWVGIFDHNE
jgi:integrase